MKKEDNDQSQFYVHDSLNHVRKDVVKKRLLTSRDLASKYYPAVSGFSYRFQRKEEDYVMSFFSGTRANGLGYLEEG